MRFLSAFVVTLLAATAAQAHTGAPIGVAAGTGGFAVGFLHHLGGPDHVLAMVGVGLFARFLGGRSLSLVPVVFLAVLALGGAVRFSGAGLPYFDMGLARPTSPN